MKLKLENIQCPIQYPHNYNFEDETYEVSDDFIRDLKFQLCGAEQTNFTTLLIRLIFKADIDNKRILSKAYPSEVLTIWAYQNVPGFWECLYEKSN
jgi:hypothetical protein